MKRIGNQLECLHLFLGYLDARGIFPGVEFGSDLKPGCCPDIPDAVDDGLVRRVIDFTGMRMLLATPGLAQPLRRASFIASALWNRLLQ